MPKKMIIKKVSKIFCFCINMKALLPGSIDALSSEANSCRNEIGCFCFSPVISLPVLGEARAHFFDSPIRFPRCFFCFFVPKTLCSFLYLYPTVPPFLTYRLIKVDYRRFHFHGSSYMERILPLLGAWSSFGLMGAVCFATNACCLLSHF